MTIKEIAVINIVVIVAVVGIILILSPTRNNTSNNISYSDSRVLDQISDVMAESEMKEAFVDSCVEEGAPKSYCTCAYNYLDSRINDREMMQLAFDLADGEIPDIMIDAVSECLYLFEY